MTLRQPHQDALLPAGDAARLRQVLPACSQLLSWAEANGGPQFAAAAQDTAEAAGLRRSSLVPREPWTSYYGVSARCQVRGNPVLAWQYC